MAKFEQWEGFQGKNWVNSVDVLSWKDLQRQQINCGENCRSCRKKNVQKAAFWIWKQK